MGRKPKYDRGKCVEKAMNLFWSRGFSGTSTRELGDCLDLKPGSIYATFGSKENLYSEAMTHYAELSLGLFESSFDEHQPFRQGLETFFSQVALSPNAPCSCMLVKTLATGEPELAEIRKQAQDLLSQFENIFVQTLARYYPERSPADLHRAARFIQVQLIGLRSYAEASTSQATLKEAIEDALTAVERQIESSA